MALESASYIDGLVDTNPVGSDYKSQGDDHLRLIKSVLKTTFPNVDGAVNATPTELNGDRETRVYSKVTSDPGGAANKAKLYAKEVGGVTELFVQDSAGNVVQVTSGGSLNATSGPTHTVSSSDPSGGSDGDVHFKV